MSSEVLAIIPARSGSKGVLNKNMTILEGKPLLQYTYDAVKESRIINRVILSTDSLEYAEYACKQDIEVRIRPKRLAGDGTPMKAVIDYHLLKLKEEGYVPDYFILLQPTSPLRTSAHIDKAMEILFTHPSADAVVSVVKVPHNFSPLKIMTLDSQGILHFYKEDGEKYTTRQELPQYYARNGAAIYAVSTVAYQRTHSLYGSRCLPYVMDEVESIDIDNINDLEIAALYLREKLSEKFQKDMECKNGEVVHDKN